MTNIELQQILDAHKKWVFNLENGKIADLSGANLSGDDLRGADLRGANLSEAYLSGANLKKANLSGADLSGADLSEANLSGANLSEADLRKANLRGADLSGANLSGADLSGADLSGAKNIFSVSTWFNENFKKSSNNDGYEVYKAIGNTSYKKPNHWIISEDSFISDNVNPVATVECGCGVNFGTLKFIKENYPNANEVWKCLLLYEDMPSLVVPWNTDGKCRCERLKLLHRIY
jgi:hypothetical protein